MSDIYEYIKSPHRAIKNGYQPTYLTRVSAVIHQTTNYGWKRILSEAPSLDQMACEFFKDLAIFSVLLPIWVILTVSIPITCWVLAFILPKGDQN